MLSESRGLLVHLRRTMSLIAAKGWRCAFCGKDTDERTKEHVVPACLYDPALLDPKVQRLTVPACKKCNHSWSCDETFFQKRAGPDCRHAGDEGHFREGAAERQSAGELHMRAHNKHITSKQTHPDTTAHNRYSLDT